MYQNNTTSLLVMGLLFGATVGVAAGLLLAPQAGNKTREILRQGIVSGADRIRELRRGVEGETGEAEIEETQTEVAETSEAQTKVAESEAEETKAD